jgi:hypothetical protein
MSFFRSIPSRVEFESVTVGSTSAINVQLQNIGRQSKRVSLAGPKHPVDRFSSAATSYL